MGQDAFSFDPPPPEPAIGPGPDAPPEQWVPRLSRLLHRQHDSARRLDELSIRQSAAIEAEDTDDLLRIVEDREPVVETMVAINRELEPFARRSGGLFAGLNAAQRADLEQQVAAVDSLLARVNERDRDDREKLEIARSVIAAELAATRAGRGAVAAYGKPTPTPGARFQDRQG